MYKAGEPTSQAGLYRCTTCGVMIPMNSAERLPRCPNGCKDAIWTFFNDKQTAPPGEIREAVQSFPAHSLRGDPTAIPVGAKLTEVRLGPERPGAERDPMLAAFHWDGQVYFGSAYELFQKTKLIVTEPRP